MFALIAHAAGEDVASRIINRVSEEIINPLILLVFACAIAVFMWGLYEMIKHGDEPEARETGRRHILWGVVGAAIMVSAYGIINFVISSLPGGGF